MNLSLLRRPSAFLPVAMSLVALVVVLANVALFGTHRQADEGAAAHVFQFLVAVQVPIALYHAVRSLPKLPAQGVRILLLQVATLLLACAPVAALGL